MVIASNIQMIPDLWRFQNLIWFALFYHGPDGYRDLGEHGQYTDLLK